MAKRYIIEGEWGGYHSGQRRIVHREVITPNNKWLARWEALQSIQYSDGTTLSISLRQAKPRERVQQILGYKSLIRDALYSGESFYRAKKTATA